ncbi:MAG: phosphatase domain-containing protein [Candidatus Kariarchaeaceae archaeon]|jgi:protein-tyrosine phosphatase
MVDNFSFVDSFLAGSAYPNSIDDIDELGSKGIYHIFSLTPNLPLVSKYLEGRDVTFHHYPVYATPDDQQIADFIEAIKDLKESGQKAVVHCQWGQERTGIFLTAYLVELQGMDVSTAMKRVQQLRPGSLQSYGSIRFLRERYA